MSSLQSFVHDAVTRLSDLRESSDRKWDFYHYSLDTGPIRDPVFGRDDPALHLHIAPKAETTQRREYQFARRYA